MRKKLLLSLWVAGLLGIASFGVVNAQLQDVQYNDTVWLNWSTSQNPGVATIWTDKDQGWNLIQVIKNAINWVLWILALIVLVIVLMWGFQMVTASGNEEKYKKWFTILKHAGIWLVIIWLSRFIVTIVFWLLRWTTWTTSQWWQW